MGMMQDSHPDHHWYQLFSEPSDFGFNGVARYRTWCIGAHRERTQILYDPFELLSAISERLSVSLSTSIPDYLVASKAEILVEASDLANRRGKAFQAHNMNLTYLLNQREMETAKILDGRYFLKFGKRPDDDQALVYYLGDNASYGSSWSAVSGKLPTFRLNSKTGLFWLPGHKRFLTSKERLAAMGWPCVLEVAEELDVPLFGATDHKRASDLLGNSMHWQSAGILQMIALTCFGPAQWQWMLISKKT